MDQPAILIVDDDPPTLALLAFYVRHFAPASIVLTAEDGQRALRQLAEHPIALLLTDYLLPDMDGVQITAAVKAASPQTYTVLASADDSNALKQRAREHGVDRFLSKLDLLAALEDVVRTALPAMDG